MQKYKKFLFTLNELLRSLPRDIEIRFNSILPSLRQTMGDYVIVTNFIRKLCSQDVACQRYPAKHQTYLNQMNAHREAMRIHNAQPASARSANTNSAEAHQLLVNSRATAPPSPPKKPTYPKLLELDSLLRDPRNILWMALLSDYIKLFDDNAKMTGSTKWMKMLTLSKIEEIEVGLRKWNDQNLQNPKSPNLKRVSSVLMKRNVKCMFIMIG